MRHFFDVVENMTEVLPTDVKFVIKEHPSCVVDYADLHERAKASGRIVFANGNSTDELVRKAEAVMTINSSVGIEAMIHKKKVIALGQAFYAGYGFAKAASSSIELTQILKDLASWHVDEALTRQYLTYLYNVYLVKGGWRKPSEEHLAEVIRRIEL